MKSVCKKLGGMLADTGGSQIAEAAFVLPLLFMVLLAIMSFGRAFNVYSTITRAAQAGAAVAATSTCGVCGNNLTDPTTDVAKAVTTTLEASKVPSNQIGTYTMTSEPTACPGPLPSAGCTTEASTKIRVCRNVQLNTGGTGAAQCGSVVSFQYPYRFQIPFASINLTTIQMTAVAEKQMEN